MTVLMKLITLSMDRSYQELPKTPIGFLLKTTTSRESDVGGVITGGRVILSMLGVIYLLLGGIVVLLLGEGGNSVVVVV
jgi:hypothetical protein